MNRPQVADRIAEARELRQQQSRQRQRRTVSHRDGMRVQLDGRTLVNFCSNDYLGLAQQFTVMDAAQEQLWREGTGTGGSHLLGGHSAVHAQLEQELADWLHAPRALVMGCGYLANLAVLQALLGEGDVCVQDRLNHASLIDAARLAGCKLRRYPHGDAEGALRQLKSIPDGAAMIATDGVFSMDGDMAPLRQLVVAARLQRALVYVDDAHGLGVVGPGGAGSVAAAKLSAHEVPLQMVTLSKALGGYGAAVVGDADLIEHLTQVARPYIYNTALPAAQAGAALAAARLARREQWRRNKLMELCERLRSGAARLGLPLQPSDTPIQPLFCGSETHALAMAAALEQAGYWVLPVRPPTVPEGTSRLRISLSAAHSEADVDGLLQALAHARDSLVEARDDTAVVA